jgi:hypothetical protein
MGNVSFKGGIVEPSFLYQIHILSVFSKSNK